MSAKKQQAQKNEFIAVLIIVIAVIILSFVFYYASKSTPVAPNAIASVNGVKITAQDLEEIALTIPPEQRNNMTEQQMLDQAIDFEIVRQEAAKIGITITDAEVNQNIDTSLQSAGITRDDAKKALDAQNIDWNTLFNAYKKQLLVYKFMNETMLKNVTVSEQEIKNFYDSYSTEINMSYEDVKDDINKTILNSKAQQVLGIFLKQKRAEYQILLYTNASQN